MVKHSTCLEFMIYIIVCIVIIDQNILWSVWLYMFMCGLIFSFMFDINMKWNLMIVYLAEEWPDYFPKWLPILYCYQQCTRVLHILAKTYLFYSYHPNGCKVIMWLVLICIYLITNYWALFHVLIGHSNIFFEKMFRFFAHFLSCPLVTEL